MAIGRAAESVSAGDVAPSTPAEWIDGEIRYRRLPSGQLQRWRQDLNRWVIAADPNKQPSAESLARKQRKIRAKEGRAKPQGAVKGRGAVPIPELTPEEKLRVKLELRTRQRQVIKDGAAPIKLVTLPGVHALSLATRYIDGGREKFIEFVQLAVLDGNATAVAWWDVYADLVPTERAIVSFDDICAAAGIRPSDFMALIVKTAMEVSRDVGNLVAAMTHPRIVEAAAKSAARIDGDGAEIGFKDRERLLQHQGIYPIPRGLSVNVHASANAQAAAAAKAEPSVPSFTQTLSAAEAIKGDVQKQLTALPAGGGLPSFIPVAGAVPHAVPVIAAELISPDEDA